MKERAQMSDKSAIQLDEGRLNRMKVAILSMEQENLRTRRRSFEAMVEQILRIVADELKKTY